MAKNRTYAPQHEISGEKWVDVAGYEGYYQVSNMGRIKSLKNQSGAIIMSGGSYGGYKNIKFTINYNNSYFRIHRLIATTFIPNPENKPEVNHINGIKSDNRVENLEWATRSENAQHSYDTGLQKPPHQDRKGSEHPSSRLVLDTQTGIFYETRNEAAMAKNVNAGSLSNMLNGKTRNKTSLTYV